eukprot:CAMPEP_0197726302 /NCGR_PEP_ID=MMETSP1434-20131217/14727_1 /TAXON_ID=265543 /ORGANISM="Minutocellus polymorphus, Strain CCMP3303" /LENGTH=247 /DNA_ID=CAMNT_0043312193 /DNA_START=112 /DNA_END=855 /DNA_ORIENTATION=+
MIDRFLRSKRFPTAALPAPALYHAAEAEQDTADLLRQKSQCADDDNTRRMTWNPWNSRSIFLFALWLVATSRMADAFVIPATGARSSNNRQMKVDTKLHYQDDYRDADEEDADKTNNGQSDELWGGDADLEAPGQVDDNLSWKVAKIRLEQENIKRFLKAGPRFLPYDECRNWVKAWNRWDTEEDWKNWIREGEKRNAYIPARPDEYYGRLGQWRGWPHFLGRGEEEECEEGGEDMPAREDDGGEKK